MKKVASWNYTTQDGEIIGVVNRLESKSDDNKKSSKQIIPCFNKDSQGQFIPGIPESINNNRPLFGLETINESIETIYIVEGEKCAAALNSAFGYTCVTSSGGSKCANKSNWDEIYSCQNFVLLPDKDNYGTGYMQDVYKILSKINPAAVFKLVNLSELPEKGDFCDWVQSKINEEWDELKPLNNILSNDNINNLKLEFDNEVTSNSSIPLEWLLDKTSNTLKCLNVNDFFKLNIPKRKHLLAPWLTERSLSMIFAGRGVGKTYFALNCAFALASGNNFIKYTNTDKVPVLYIDGEMTSSLMQERLKQISGGNAENIPIYLINPDLQADRGIPDLSSIEGQNEFDEIIDKLGVKVIFIDNLSTLCRTGRENEGESWLSIQSWAIRQRSKGNSIVFIHHANKNGEQRGSSRREDVLDNVIQLKRPDDYDESIEGLKLEVHFTKARSLFGEDIKPILTTLNKDGEWDWSYLKNKQEQAIEMKELGLNQTEIAESLNVNKSTVSRWLKK